jgi:RimJ/RimL family protein N-acetyltransferase/GNAT superfamily N-acetyltransferase/8-oxo-dGTP pyrophosphatase MutT (NUDIX family)
MVDIVSAPIVVRKFNESDAASVNQYLQSANVKTSFPHAFQEALGATTDFPTVPEQWKADRIWVIEKNGNLIGHFFVWNVSDAQRWVEIIGTFAAPASEEEIVYAFEEMMTILFQVYQMHKVILLVHPDCLFFFGIARRLLFLLEGTLHKHMYLHGSWHDVCVFSLIRDDQKKPTQDKETLSVISKHEWLLKQAAYDGINIIFVRTVILRMEKEKIDVLLLKRAPTAIMPNLEEPPGGKVNEGESLLQALSRIVYEQTALTISQDTYFLTSFDFSTNLGERVREFVFRVEPISTDIIIDNIEHDSSFWCPLQDLHSTKLHPDMIQILSSYTSALSYESENCPVHEHEAVLELIRPPKVQLEEAILTGLHLDAYAAKGLSAIEPIGLVLRDSANRIVGGLIFDLLYGCLFLRRLWVDPNWRRLGWGKKLILRAETIAREKGCHFALGLVMDWEDVGFFQKLGFFVESQHAGFQHNSRQFRFRKELY